MSSFRTVLLGMAAVTLLTAGCGSAGSTSESSSSASSPQSPSTHVGASSPAGPLAAWPCLADVGATAAVVPGTPDLTLAFLGTGTRIVIFSNESDEDLCSWLPFAHRLVDRGFEVALYDYVAAPQDDLARAIAFTRRRSATAVALIGASEGAKTSIVEGATVSPPVQAVVSLSAEAALQGVAVAPYAAKVRVPTMFVTAAHDAYGATSATTGFYRAAPARTKRLVTVPGSAHGTALLRAAAVTTAVLAFVVAHDR